jgi:hypothetical protein
MVDKIGYSMRKNLDGVSMLIESKTTGTYFVAVVPLGSIVNTILICIELLLKPRYENPTENHPANKYDN